jgi:TetR/AcrR family transcriptional regulator, transcriptional repressor for nem operon
MAPALLPVIIDIYVQNSHAQQMARPKEFDIEAALQAAKSVFWEKGFEATSTEDLRLAMGIGRQSFYDSFGGKREIFLAALGRYIDERVEQTTALLQARSPLAGIKRLLGALADETSEERARGCFGVSSMSELGVMDEEVRSLGERSTKRVLEGIASCLRRAKRAGELPPDLREREAAAHLHATIVGMRVLAKGGARPELLRDIARSALQALGPTRSK